MCHLGQVARGKASFFWPVVLLTAAPRVAFLTCAERPALCPGSPCLEADISGVGVTVLGRGEGLRTGWRPCASAPILLGLGA